MRQDKIIEVFLTVISKDQRVEFSHVSLFLAIYYRWEVNHFTEAIPISRSRLMTLSKIKSTSTYHKCIKELEDLGCIKYEPSYHPKGSLIFWGEMFRNWFVSFYWALWGKLLAWSWAFLFRILNLDMGYELKPMKGRQNS